MSRVNKSNIAQLLLLVALTIAAMLIFEHSQWDVSISQLFYDNGNWLLEKAHSLIDLFFMMLPNYY